MAKNTGKGKNKNKPATARKKRDDYKKPQGDSEVEEKKTERNRDEKKVDDDSGSDMESTDLEPEKITRGNLTPVIVIAFLFVVSIGFALLLAPIYVNMGLQADFSEFGGEESLWIPVFYIIVILVFTAVILFITRKRKGRFIKYGFLGIICLSMSYVFWAVFDLAFFPIPDQEWSDEVIIDGGVSTILIIDLVGDSDVEIIVGTNSGDIEVYDHNRNLMWSTAPQNALSGPIHELAAEDLNQDNQLELIAVSSNVNILEIRNVGENYEFNETWSASNIDFTSLAVIPNYPIRGNTSLGRIPAVVVSHSSITGDTISSGLLVVSYYDNGYHSHTLNNTIIWGFPINTIIYGEFNDSDTPELYLGSNEAIYSIDPINPEAPQEIITDVGNVIEIQIANIDKKGANELIAYDEDGQLYIFEANKAKPRWQKDVGGHIGGLAFEDIFESTDGLEMTVSVDGRVYIYYKDSDDGFLDERYEFTEETGRLNKDATGLAIGSLDDNDDPDIIIGDESGFKHYQYLWYYASDIPCYMGLIASLLITIFLFKYPEWYVVDISGVVVAAGVTALLGVSIGLLPLILLLMVLAIYDAISVYKTKHMVSLADKVMEFRLPILLVVPKRRGYSFLRQKGLQKQLDDGEEREAMFIGLGDIIIPGALVVSAFHFLPATIGLFGLGANLLVAIFTLVGTLVGFAALMQYVLKGNPQAGLPLLNTGAIMGFFISNYIIYQDLTFGLALPF